MELIIRIILLISSGASFFIGAIHFMSKKVALFKVLVTASLGCFMLGRLYDLVTYLVCGNIPNIFNIGTLGIVGGFLFIFSASYSQMDSLVDDKSKELRKYRIISFIAPLIIAGVGAFIQKANLSIALKIFFMLIIDVIAIASYYNLKHIIIPDVSGGIIRSIRQYSISALILEFFTAIQIVTDKLNLTTLWIISSIFVAIYYPLVLLAMDKGCKKWTL